MQNVIICVFFAFFGLQGGYGDSSLGSCPIVHSEEKFEIDKFLGVWYAIQTTTDDTYCTIYNISKNEEKPGHYKLTEIKPKTGFISSYLSSKEFDETTGDIHCKDPTKPGDFVVSYSLEIVSSAFKVFMTNYHDYAGIFTCKKLPLMHRWSAEIISRTPVLDMNFVDQIRTRLSSYNIDPFNLKFVKQEKCARPKGLAAYSSGVEEHSSPPIVAVEKSTTPYSVTPQKEEPTPSINYIPTPTTIKSKPV